MASFADKFVGYTCTHEERPAKVTAAAFGAGGMFVSLRYTDDQGGTARDIPWANVQNAKEPAEAKADGE